MKRDVLIWMEGGIPQEVEILLPSRAMKKCDLWAKEKGFKDYEDFMNSDYDGDDDLRWFEGTIIDGTELKMNPSKRVQ